MQRLDLFRDAVRDWVCRLTGAESATAVNNCAAATVLVLRALAAGREVVVSRGQLVEIGAFTIRNGHQVTSRVRVPIHNEERTLATQKNQVFLVIRGLGRGQEKIRIAVFLLEVLYPPRGPKVTPNALQILHVRYANSRPGEF